MEMYDATSKTNTMTIYTFLSQNLKPSIVASSPCQLFCSQTYFWLFSDDIYFEKEKRKLSLH